MVFNIFSMLFHSLLAYRMSAEKSADGLIEVSFVGYNPFFLVDFKIVSLSSTFDNLV